MIDVPELAGKPLDSILRWMAMHRIDTFCIDLMPSEAGERTAGLIALTVMIEPNYSGITQAIAQGAFR